MKNILLISFIFFFKANSQTPTCLWAKSINQASTVFFYNIAIDNEDNFIAVGSRCDMNSIDSSLPNSIFDGLFIKKMDSSGNLIWYRTVTSELSEAINPHVVKVDKENNIYI